MVKLQTPEGRGELRVISPHLKVKKSQNVLSPYLRAKSVQVFSITFSFMFLIKNIIISSSFNMSFNEDCGNGKLGEKNTQIQINELIRLDL